MILALENAFNGIWFDFCRHDHTTKGTTGWVRSCLAQLHYSGCLFCVNLNCRVIYMPSMCLCVHCCLRPGSQSNVVHVTEHKSVHNRNCHLFSLLSADDNLHYSNCLVQGAEPREIGFSTGNGMYSWALHASHTEWISQHCVQRAGIQLTLWAPFTKERTQKVAEWKELRKFLTGVLWCADGRDAQSVWDLLRS